MFVYQGKVKCTHPKGRQAQWYSLRFEISLFPPHISVGISDSLYQNQHVLENTRFNFQSRDSYLDLMARDAWHSVWWDKYEGFLALKCPTLDRIPKKLDVRVTASWDEPFVILEFKLGNDFCQVSTRPRAGSYGWRETRPIWDSSPILIVPPTDSAPAAASTDIPPSDPETYSGDESIPSDEEDDIENIPNSRTTIQDYDETENFSNPRISIQDVETNESVPTHRNLSSIENDSTIASPREWDSPYEYPVEIDFDRVGFTSNESGKETRKVEI